MSRNDSDVPALPAEPADDLDLLAHLTSYLTAAADALAVAAGVVDSVAGKLRAARDAAPPGSDRPLEHK